MLPTFGHIALVIGLAASLFAAGAFGIGGRSGDDRALSSGRRGLDASFALAVLACGVMVYSLLTHDFSILYVARNNATTTPPFFSFISLWAALEG